MNATMEFVSGRCTNELFCAVASAGDVVRVPVGSRCVCAYCGGKLVQSVAPRRRIGLRGGMIIGGGMGLTGLAMFAVGFSLGDPPPSAANLVAAPAPIPQFSAMAPPPAGPPARAASAAAPRGQSALLPAPRADSWAAPPRPAPVVLAMAERPAANPVPAAPRPAAAAPAAEKPSEADDLNAREAARVAPPPARIVAYAPQRTNLAFAPAQGFVPHPIAGGAPAYPAAYEGTGRRGRVSVSCRIESSGAPTGCHIVANAGGQAFATAVRNWLDSGQVRFDPVVRDGRPTAETHQWTLEFEPQ